MTAPDKKKIEGEMEGAWEALEDAEHNLKEERLHTAVSRAYYAIFHAARAVLWSRGFGPKTHKGVSSQFHEHLVKTGKVSKAFGGILGEARDEREEADYLALSEVFVKENIASLVVKARDFVEQMNRTLYEP